MKVKQSHATIARRLGIPLSRLRDANVRAAFDEHLAKLRKIADEPEQMNVFDLSQPPGAVGQLTTSNRFKPERGRK